MSNKCTYDLAIPATDARRIIETAWFDLVGALSGHHTRDLEIALDTEMKDERRHRACGRRFATRGWRPSYRLSVELASKLFILQWLYKAPESVDLSELNSLRESVVRTWSLAARMRKSVAYVNGDKSTTTHYVRFQERVCESKYVSGKPLLRGGRIDQIPACQKQLQRILLARCERDALYQESEQDARLHGPMFMALDYSKDIADNA